MKYILKLSDGTPIHTADDEIKVDNVADAFRCNAYVWYDPRPSSGAYVEVDLSPDVPPEVTMRQARLALLEAGMLAAIPVKISELPQADVEKATIEWEYSSTVQRHNGFVAALAPALGLTDNQLDALFIRAAQF